MGFLDLRIWNSRFILLLNSRLGSLTFELLDLTCPDLVLRDLGFQDLSFLLFFIAGFEISEFGILNLGSSIAEFGDSQIR